MKNSELTQAICESRENDKVTRFVDHEEFTSEIQKMLYNGQIWGVYNTTEGVVAEDIWGDIHPDIFKS